MGSSRRAAALAAEVERLRTALAQSQRSAAETARRMSDLQVEHRQYVAHSSGLLARLQEQLRALLPRAMPPADGTPDVGGGRSCTGQSQPQATPSGMQDHSSRAGAVMLQAGGVWPGALQRIVPGTAPALSEPRYAPVSPPAAAAAVAVTAADKAALPSYAAMRQRASAAWASGVTDAVVGGGSMHYQSATQQAAMQQQQQQAAMQQPGTSPVQRSTGWGFAATLPAAAGPSLPPNTCSPVAPPLTTPQEQQMQPAVLSEQHAAHPDGAMSPVQRPGVVKASDLCDAAEWGLAPGLQREAIGRVFTDAGRVLLDDVRPPAAAVAAAAAGSMALSDHLAAARAAAARAAAAALAEGAAAAREAGW